MIKIKTNYPATAQHIPKDKSHIVTLHGPVTLVCPYCKWSKARLLGCTFFVRSHEEDKGTRYVLDKSHGVPRIDGNMYYNISVSGDSMVIEVQCCACHKVYELDLWEQNSGVYLDTNIVGVVEQDYPTAAWPFEVKSAVDPNFDTSSHLDEKQESAIIAAINGKGVGP